jgi:hypothetical protein
MPEHPVPGKSGGQKGGREARRAATWLTENFFGTLLSSFADFDQLIRFLTSEGAKRFSPFQRKSSNKKMGNSNLKNCTLQSASHSILSPTGSDSNENQQFPDLVSGPGLPFIDGGGLRYVRNLHAQSGLAERADCQDTHQRYD